MLLKYLKSPEFHLLTIWVLITKTLYLTRIIMPIAFPKRSSAPARNTGGLGTIGSVLPYGLSFLAFGSALNVLTENPILLVGLAGVTLLILKR